MLTQKIDRDSTRREPGIKGFLYWWLENRNNNKIILADIILNLIIFASIYFVFVEFSLEDSTPDYIVKMNTAFLVFFTIEYLTRFYISSDFLWDAFRSKDASFVKAVTNKLRWMIKFFSLIDLISLLPAIRYLRIFRALRILRLLRLLRFLRVLKIFRNFEKYLLVFRGLTESWRVFCTFIFGIAFIVGVFSFGIYLFEVRAGSQEFDTYGEAFRHSLGIIGLFEGSPSTMGGKIFSSLVTLSELFFIGIIISFMTVKVEDMMSKVKSGGIGKITFKGHIVICGYTRSAQNVIDNLLSGKYANKSIVLVTLQEDPDINGVIYHNGDFADDRTLRRVNIQEAEKCIIFAEQRGEEDKRTTDMRTVMTVYNVKSQYENVHTISEINYAENSKIIKDRMHGDELIFKEKIDASIINSCIEISYISPLIYEMLNNEGKKLQQRDITEFDVKPGASMQEIRECTLSENMVILGLMRDHKPVLVPNNDFVLNDKDKVIVLG